MDQAVLKGKWRELRGAVKEKWGRLTDDELTEAEGTAEKLIGLLQSRYGYSRAQAEREFQDFLDRDKDRDRVLRRGK